MFLIFLALFLLGGCAQVMDYGFQLAGDFWEDKAEKTPDELMIEGMEDLEKGNYEAAAEAFQDIKDRYPYSRHAITAELKMADALFQTKEYEEAFDAYSDFERLHPKNKNTPYVIYQKGMCHFKQITTVDRDQTHTLTAKHEFERLVRRFPRAAYAKKARRNIRKCLIYLAEYELYVGHYYFKMGNYRAAMDRYNYIIRNYPDMGQYHVAMEYMSRCREKLAKGEGIESSSEEFSLKSKALNLIRKLNPF